MSDLLKIKKELREMSSAEKAKASAWFFKTDKGQYGYGDVFIGVTVPEQRKVAKKYSHLSLADLERLLCSREHEFRLTALIILVEQYKRADDEGRKKIHRMYLANTKWVNNWDLVDTSVGWLVGDFLKDKDRRLLYKLARSRSLWERRMAMIATFPYIRAGDCKDAFAIAEMLLGESQDLLHKAVGWMLREVGKNCGHEVEEIFLKKHYRTMPRTALRYALEHFPEKKRRMYMAK